MPTREAFLHVFIVDPTGKPLPPSATRTIVLRPAGGGGAIAPDKPYSAAEGVTYKLSSADLELVIAYEGFTELHQWFTAVAPAEQPKLAAYWPGTDRDPSAAGKRAEYLLECMSLQRVSGGAAADRSPTVFHVTVALHPMREYVAAIGTDYWEGAFSTTETPHKASLDFIAYSVVHAHHLSAAGVLNPSSPFTVLSCQEGTVETWMRTRMNGWRRQKVLKPKLPAPKWPTVGDYRTWYNGLTVASVTTYLSAVDIYSYLSTQGAARPGTVVDFGIWSHAWAGGPILFNTGDDTNAARNPFDMDMRTKDFNATNATLWASMPLAFTADATLQVWGCFATTAYRDIINYAGRTRTDTREKFTFPGWAPLTRAEALAQLTDAVENSYMKALARFAHRPTYGGPPGYGAEIIDYPSLPDIPADLKKKVKGKILHIPSIVNPKATARRMYDSGIVGSPNWNPFGYMRYPP